MERGNLTLSRKLGQAIAIGDVAVVTVTKIRGNDVTLRITAPKDVTVLRGELTGKEPPCKPS
jgi:carbon storage regulator